MEEAFLKSVDGKITGVMGAEDTEKVRANLIRWLIDDKAEMVIRVPVELAKRSFFKSTASVLSELENA
ncbi:hypothetical protein [Rhizobium alvei]|uniref:Uncharacterized protein n=1 Tax=Rhizobium alvei TaxID=1132659 RepID=A0ABT8YTV3_9HYPH|nr:hypothetical protein [Rhizobium alvei]MDO6966950.1 hypothetical protein [Rhizobium alvei]